MTIQDKIDELDEIHSLLHRAMRTTVTAEHVLEAFEKSLAHRIDDLTEEASAENADCD